MESRFVDPFSISEVLHDRSERDEEVVVDSVIVRFEFVWHFADGTDAVDDKRIDFLLGASCARQSKSSCFDEFSALRLRF